MIIVNVMYTMKRGKKAVDFLEALESSGLAPYCRREEGNHCYRYFLPADGAEQLFLLEKWDDEASLAAHAKTDNFARIGELKEAYVEETDIQKYVVVE